MEKIFKIHIHGLPYQEDYKEIISELQKQFFTKQGTCLGDFYLLNENFESFLEMYIGNEKINWDWLCKESITPWTEEILTKYSKYWNWKLLIQNPSITWTLSLIKNNAKHIDFADFYENVDIKWNKANINALKSLVYFSNKGIKKGTWAVFEDYSYLFNNRYPNSSLSLSEKINWTDDIIEEFKDNWDWGELSFNKNIHWNKELITKYEELIDFDLLSLNENVDWSLEILEKYKSKLNWIYLSGNPNLPWSTDFILKNERKWIFGNEQISKYDLNSYKIYTLSENKGIKWTLQLFDRYINKLNIWEISLNGKIEKAALIKYHEKFDEKKYSGCFLYKYSDWRDSFSVYTNCWQNLVKNPNVDTKLINDDFFKKKTFEYKEPNGNLAKDGTVESKLISIDYLFKNGVFQIIDNVEVVSCY